MIKIAISGKANSGKDTISKMFCELIHPFHKYTKNHCKIIAFADPIKNIIKTMYPQIDPLHLFGSSEYRGEIIPGSFVDGVPLTIRRLLQDFGEGCKKYNPKIWIDVFDNKLKKCEKDKINIVIASDLRFIDELNYLRENGFVLIRLLKPDDVPQMSHISETQQNQIKDEEFNFIINNDGTLNDLNNKVLEIVNKIQ